MMDPTNSSSNNGPKYNSFGYTRLLLGLQMQNWSILINDITHQFSRKEQTIKCALLWLEHAAESNNAAKFPKLNSDQK